jgi:hypothetical protein
VKETPDEKKLKEISDALEKSTMELKKLIEEMGRTLGKSEGEE